MKLIEDLGMIEYGSQGQKTRYGLYECPECNKAFKCIVANVKRGKVTRCRSCASIAMNASRVTEAANNFIAECSIIHKDKYLYSLVEYINNHTNVAIICKQHGVFSQRPANHKNGSGCPECASISRITVVTTKVASVFSEICTIVHNDAYDYSLVDYITGKESVNILCKIHGIFRQTPDNHKHGKGCPECAEYGFNLNRSAILYYLKVTDGDTVLYKIGVTNRTVRKRYKRADMLKIQIIATWEFSLGVNALDLEKSILKEYKNFIYTGRPVLSSGNTELFTVDVLGLCN